MKTIIIIIVLFLVGFISNTNATQFISECFDDSWKLENSKLVIEGKVINVEKTIDTTFVSIEVNKYIKGSDLDIVTFKQPGGTSTIVSGFADFEENEDVRVYLSIEENEYSILCGEFGKKLLVEQKGTLVSPYSENFQLILEDSYNIGEEIEIKLKNNGTTKIHFSGPDSCKKFFRVHKYISQDNKWELLSTRNPCEACEMFQVDIEINPRETKTIGIWNQKVYDNSNCNNFDYGKQVKSGKYKIDVTVTSPASIEPYVGGGEVTIGKEIEINGKTSENDSIQENETNGTNSEDKSLKSFFSSLINWLKSFFR